MRGRQAYGFAIVVILGWLVGAGLGCGSSPGSGGHDDGTGGDGTAGDDSASGANGDFCAGGGPIVPVSTGSSTTTWSTCSGTIAATTFVNALCTCRDTTLAGYLQTRSFDSNQGPPGSGNLGGAAVGINNAYSISAGYTDVGGSFTVGGSQASNLVGYLQVRGDLSLAGETFVAGATDVGRDAWLGARFSDLGPMDVAHDLHHQAEVSAVLLNVGGANTQEPVTVAPPCRCDPQDLLNVGAVVDYIQAHNDNAANGISPSVLNNVIGLTEVTLPCGKYFLERMDGIGGTIVNVTGRVALAIDGDLNAIGMLEFKMSPDAEIDIFIRGNLTIGGYAEFGDEGHPANTRIYVAGSRDITLVGGGIFVGNIYAPRARVLATGYAEIHGSLFALDFNVPGYANFLYDSAILGAGDECPETSPPGTCDTCGTCAGGLACVDGSCGQCRTDADCCAPLVCAGGYCSPLIL
jgi:hypothetical protein